MNEQIEGIYVYVGTPEGVQGIPAECKLHAIVLTVDVQQSILQAEYHDPFGMNHKILGELDKDTVQHGIKALMEERQSSMSHEPCQLFYLNAKEIGRVFDIALMPYLHAGEVYAKQYFDFHPQTAKFSRKESGLSHSYLHSGEKIIELANKNECRVVWTKTKPDATLFNNLPENTSAAVVAVQSEKDASPSVYYLRAHNGNQAKLITEKLDLQQLEQFKLNHRGLSKAELKKFGLLKFHQIDRRNQYGEGGLAHVKRAVDVHQQPTTQQAIKIQKLKKIGAIETKISSKESQKTRFQQEERITSDVFFEGSKVLTHEDKMYMPMPGKGEGLDKVIQTCNVEKKIDYAIKFLMAVAKLHAGETLSGTKYAHRDLKLANAVVDSSDNVHLIDFGLATSDLNEKTEQLGGTLVYAPLDQTIIDHYLQRANPSEKANMATGAQATSHKNTSDSEYEGSLQSDFLATKQKSTLDSEEYGSMLDEDFLDSESGFTKERENQQTADEKYQANASEQGPIEANLPKNWTDCLMNERYCITKNYLQDDKIAAIRTIYNPVKSQKTGALYSIFTSAEFAKLPNPIRQLFDAETIAPLFANDRERETEFFLAAVMIYYKEHQHEADETYTTAIAAIRNNPEYQQSLLKKYANLRIESPDSTKSETTELDNISDELAARSQASSAQTVPQDLEKIKSPRLSHFFGGFSFGQKRSKVYVKNSDSSDEEEISKAPTKKDRR